MNQPIHLLHVEDETLDQRAVARMVRDKGLPWELTLAPTLAEARAHLGRTRFDLILADYHLPDGECTELIGEAPDTPFILLTATLEEHLALRTLERGADDYLPKDAGLLYLDALPIAVAKALHRRRLHEAEQRLTRQLRESEERLRLMVEGVSDYAIFMLDPQGRVVTWNRGAQQMKGYTADQIIGRHFSVCYTPQDNAAGKPDHMLAAAAQGGTFAGEGWLLRRDGSRFWASTSITAVRDESGQLRGFAYITHDLTVRKRMEDELRELTRTLEDRVAQRTAEARRQAAQLRWLHAELTSAELRERKHLARMLHDGLQQILVAAKMRLGLLDPDGRRGRDRDPLRQIDDLLTQAIETSRSLTAELVPPVLYDRGLVPGLKWLVRHMNQKHECTIALLAEDEAEPAREDLRVVLFEAARELIFNAVKHADACRVRVSLERAGDEQGRFWTRLMVEDEGPGFDPAANGGEASTRGFGLFNLRERAQAIGGELIVDSMPGRPTRVVMSVPVVAAEPRPEPGSLAAPVLAPAAPDANHAGIRVLLADDHKAMRDGIANLLQLEPGIQVVGEAADGQQAVDLAHQLHPDVIIMDVTMPRLDGIEATRRIRRELPGIGVVGLSMHNDPSVAQAMQAAGASVYLSKDGPLRDMVQAVRQCASN
jgi:PAS domain S-box-containing protein